MKYRNKKIHFYIENICSWELEVPSTVYPPKEDTYLLARSISRLREKNGLAFEIGCGSGALSLLMAKLGWDVKSCDINPYAVASARYNAEKFGLTKDINVEESGVGDGLIIPKETKLIIWNLPYLNPLSEDEEKLEYIEDAAFIDLMEEGWSKKLIDSLEKDGIGDRCLVMLLFRTYPKSPSSPESWKSRGWAGRKIASETKADEKLEVYAFWKPGQGEKPLIIDECRTTMDEAKKIVNREWSRVLTKKQTEGRGRRFTEWNSEEGDMMATWNIPKRDIEDVPIGLLQVTIGALVADALSANLKWPNDIMTNDFRKMGGIIVESSSEENVIRVGIGINKKKRKITDVPISGWMETLGKVDNMYIFGIIDGAISSYFEYKDELPPVSHSDMLECSWRALSRNVSRGVLIKNNSVENRIIGLTKNGELEILNNYDIIINDKLDDMIWEYDVKL